MLQAGRKRTEGREAEKGQQTNPEDGKPPKYSERWFDMEKCVSLLWSQLLECFRWLPINCSVFPQDKNCVLSLLGKPFGHFQFSLYLKLIGPSSLQLWQIAHLFFDATEHMVPAYGFQNPGKYPVYPHFNRRRNWDSKALMLHWKKWGGQRWALRPGHAEADHTALSLRMLIPQTVDEHPQSSSSLGFK